MPESPQRLFFALLPDEGVRERLLRFQESLGPAGGRPVPAENLHLTLLFLGDVEAGKVETLREVIAGVEGEPFELVLDTCGSFKQSKVRLLWLAPSEPPPELGALHRSLCREVEGLGLNVQEGPFRPHVTLVRKAKLRESRLEDPERGIPWSVRRCALLASELLPDGSRYRALAEKNF